jgi:hypothetical protein
MNITIRAVLVLVLASNCASLLAAVLEPQKLLDKQTFWDNRDWDWYKSHIPFFECPDEEINTTYYYRWELVTKHLVYGSPNSGYNFTEFIDRPFWSGKYGSISCPAGHQLYEVRWLRDPQIARDYSRYWFRTEGAQPRRYSTWLADAIVASTLVHPDDGFLKDLLPDLVKNYQGWEREHFVPAVGLFWQTGHDDGMEININSRQTQDTVRGAPGFRPTLNAYMYADALAIAQVAELAGDAKLAGEYRARATSLKVKFNNLCWDEKRQFYLHVYMRNEQREGQTIQAMSKVYETGKYAGSPHGREEIGFVPWQFDMAAAGREIAWKFLMHRDYFFADFGPTTTERNDPMFALARTCCWWSGQSWPYATTQTLKGLANLLQSANQDVISREDYLKLLKVYTMTQRKNGKPYIAEAANPDTGSWEGHDSYNHSEHYFHSGYNDLIVTGLVGLRPRADETLEIDPLAPESWDYFALDNLAYRGHEVAILWDRTGMRYNQGQGLTVLCDGQKVGSSPKLAKLSVKMPTAPPQRPKSAGLPEVNFAVNNDGTYFPHLTASYTAPKTSLTKIVDGNYWYHLNPPNRWTAEGSANAMDSVTLDFGVARPLHTVKLYFLDDGEKITAPAKCEVEQWSGKEWKALATLEHPQGHRATVVAFAPIETAKLRFTFTHDGANRTGLTEIEAWGPAKLPLAAAPPPIGNLAYNPGNQAFPKASASFTSRFDKAEQANDGITSFSPESPHNRWSAFESPNASDWLEIDFGQEKQVGRVELALYSDGGGVQAPASYTIQLWDGKGWVEAANQRKEPEKPTGQQFNTVKFDPARASKVRVVFTQAPRGKAGVSEMMVWPE